MGEEQTGTAVLRGRRIAGKALLETDELIFRGPAFRLNIRLADISELTADDATLTVTSGDETVQFEIGAKAWKWADKIRNPKSLIDKLGVKPEHRVVVLNVRDDNFIGQLVARAPDVSTRLRKNADVIVFGAESLAELARLRSLRDGIKLNGMIWTVTPKGKGGIKDTDVMAAGKAAGLVDVKVASFSATHSAAKFVIPKANR